MRALNDLSIGVLFRSVWLKIEGTGLDGVYPIYQGNPSIFPKGHLCLCLYLVPTQESGVSGKSGHSNSNEHGTRGFLFKPTGLPRPSQVPCCRVGVPLRSY